MSTAPENTGGVILVGSASFGVDVTICAVSGEGNGDFYIWWNGTSDPSPG